MAKKKRGGKNSETLGVSGFTLGIVSLVLVLFDPSAGVLSSIIGFIFCKIQQKNKPTKFGRRGIIINVIGFIANVIFWILLIQIIYPYLIEQFGELPV